MLKGEKYKSISKKNLYIYWYQTSLKNCNEINHRAQICRTESKDKLFKMKKTLSKELESFLTLSNSDKPQMKNFTYTSDLPTGKSKTPNILLYSGDSIHLGDVPLHSRRGPSNHGWLTKWKENGRDYSFGDHIIFGGRFRVPLLGQSHWPPVHYCVSRQIVPPPGLCGDYMGCWCIVWDGWIYRMLVFFVSESLRSGEGWVGCDYDCFSHLSGVILNAVMDGWWIGMGVPELSFISDFVDGDGGCNAKGVILIAVPLVQEIWFVAFRNFWIC